MHFILKALVIIDEHSGLAGETYRMD